ncbi:MAG: hypothetical protein JRI57_03580 [Deltaproteobacteria bacterium]|nr:hypothetical protein [Deltaproteobacteria bacterium]MBW1951819.1 hypothetical protein [Deltaproteobacteria bacterium]MBW1985616.1 hypothetical protein [Deltaproteobacteria bacterium]MBW2134445.1 hypothetical protein [Deltaproteobacteria bacterium]
MSVVNRLLPTMGGRFATALGIDLKGGPQERQKWLLAAILFGARISGELAARTYQVFAANRITEPQAILRQGWDRLVDLLDEGGYARYDFKTATKLLTAMANLQQDYQGDIEQLHAVARDARDLEKRLMKLAPGIGPTTVEIFLRELRGVWLKAAPRLSPLAAEAAKHLGLVPSGLTAQAALEALQQCWAAESLAGYDFADLEAALVRLGRDYCRKAKGPPCPMAAHCQRPECPRRPFRNK